MAATITPLAMLRVDLETTEWAEAIAQAQQLPHNPAHLLYTDFEFLAWLPHRKPRMADRWLRAHTPAQRIEAAHV